MHLPHRLIAPLSRWAAPHGPLAGAAGRLVRRITTRLSRRVERALAAGGDPCLVELHGVSLRVPLPLATALLSRRFDPLTIGRLRQHTRPGMTAVDVGAHVGFYTLLLARLVAPGGRVVAVEPAPANLDLLRRNLAPGAPVPIAVLAVAAGAQDGDRTLRLSDSSDTHSFYQHPLVGRTQPVLVAQRRLDHLLPTPPDVIKIDVEGAELEALEGLEGVITPNSPRTILVEVNPACLAAAGSSPAALLGWLDRHGFGELELLDELAGVVHRGAEARRAALDPERPNDWFANLLAARR